MLGGDRINGWTIEQPATPPPSWGLYKENGNRSRGGGSKSEGNHKNVNKWWPKNAKQGPERGGVTPESNFGPDDQIITAQTKKKAQPYLITLQKEKTSLRERK